MPKIKVTYSGVHESAPTTIGVALSRITRANPYEPSGAIENLETRIEKLTDFVADLFEKLIERGAITIEEANELILYSDCKIHEDEQYKHPYNTNPRA